jgi:hypothetical protein
VSVPSGIGAARHPAAGEAARGFAAPDGVVERPSGRDLADHLEARRRVGDVGRAHGVAVHGRHVGGRLGALRREVGGEHAMMGVDQARVLGRQRGGAGEHLGERIGDRQQCHGQAPGAR